MTAIRAAASKHFRSTLGVRGLATPVNRSTATVPVSFWPNRPRSSAENVEPCCRAIVDVAAARSRPITERSLPVRAAVENHPPGEP